ncbi:hypothetical protein K466DRAFT_584046 [Polyporus arcularius HHB13444]|uniref:Uncharacterized protein n=1 Tax=Polyporus arcularius HHB13444 TaxID=1314778 RepID=A0A5C3PK17_9APHY|nr:hypothetical protein K466DRAFT_584046 [Polyporus arcularius HHB13444]
MCAAGTLHCDGSSGRNVYRTLHLLLVSATLPTHLETLGRPQLPSLTYQLRSVSAVSAVFTLLPLLVRCVYHGRTDWQSGWASDGL